MRKKYPGLQVAGVECPELGFEKDQTAVLIATLNVPDLEKLSRVMARIESVRDVIAVQREGR